MFSFTTHTLSYSLVCTTVNSKKSGFYQVSMFEINDVTSNSSLFFKIKGKVHTERLKTKFEWGCYTINGSPFINDDLFFIKLAKYIRYNTYD